MKKRGKSFLCVVFLAISVSGFSQFTFGPSVGTNFTSFVGKTSMKAGLDAGVFFRFGSKFYFQPEVEYSWSNSSFKNSKNESVVKIKNQYINVPLLFGFKFGNSTNFNFRLFVGPRLGFMIQNNYEKGENPFGTIQVGGEAGIGVDLWRFTLDFSYNFSASQPNPDLVSTQWWKQNMLCLSLGFKILKN